MTIRITNTTRRIAQASQAAYGSATDEDRRRFIRYNINALAANPTFWLHVNAFYNITPPVPDPRPRLLIADGEYLLVGRRQELLV